VMSATTAESRRPEDTRTRYPRSDTKNTLFIEPLMMASFARYARHSPRGLGRLLELDRQIHREKCRAVACAAHLRVRQQRGMARPV
jgi:hypothetical protein